MKDSSGQEIFDVESEGSDCDAYFTKAVYENGSPVSDVELDLARIKETP